jgi:hypothetical protein
MSSEAPFEPRGVASPANAPEAGDLEPFPTVSDQSVLLSTSFQVFVGFLWLYTGLALMGAVAQAGSGTTLLAQGTGTASLGWLVWWVGSSLLAGVGAAGACAAIALTSGYRVRREMARRASLGR